MQLEEPVIRPITQSRIDQVDFENLEFGKYISDHMLVCDYNNKSWQTPKIVPFADMSMSPAMLALHYGQSVFEGLKAFRMGEQQVCIFRPDKHYERLNRSLARMCMPEMPEELFINGLKQLIKLDEEWVPHGEGTALYIRPIVFASEARFGVKVSDEYRFIIFTGPTGKMFQRPLRVKVETHYSRAARGGTGAAKCAGNYGGAFLPTQKAREEGYDQVLWTDASEHINIEESGMMNAMFVLDGVLVTPPLSDSILGGVTRDALLTLAKDLGIPAEERPVSIQELQGCFRNNTITEAFGAGTAAVVSPIEAISIHGVDHYLPSYNKNSIMFRLLQELESIREGKTPDRHNWIVLV
jgi:branched-chain amino acid aminotransferase